MADTEAASKAECETIKSLKNRVKNVCTDTNSSYRKRKGTKADNVSSDTSLGAVPKRLCQTRPTTEDKLPGPAITCSDQVARKPGKAKRSVAPKTPSVAQWLKTLQPPPTPPTQPLKTSTPAKELSVASVSVCEDLPRVLNSTQNSDLDSAVPSCDLSNVEVPSFGTTSSSVEAHLNEAIDRSEACQDFENPDRDTQDLLTAACEASRPEIDRYCGANGEHLAILANLSRSKIWNEHLSSGPQGNEHDTHLKSDDQDVQNLVSVAPDSTLLRVKSTAEVASVPAEKLLEAKSASAAIWKSWVDARATAVKGERHSKPITFAQAFENAKLLEISKRSMDACTTNLGKLAMMVPEAPMRYLPAMLPQEDQVTSSLCQLVKDDSANHVPLLQMPDTCVPNQREPAQESLMDEIGDKPGPLCRNMRPQGVLTAAVHVQPSSMEMASVIGCGEMESTNGERL